MRNLHATGRWLLLVGVASCALGLGAGCTRQFYRKRADVEVACLLNEKDIFPAWKVRNMHVYPHPLARFADPTNPDRPPMPPDDPAATLLAPNPQRSKHHPDDVAWIEGSGYLDLLAAYDKENRTYCAEPADDAGPAKRADAGVQQASFQQPGGDLPVPKELQQTPAIEDPPISRDVQPWQPKEHPGFKLRLDQAVELGMINSREYQARREDLYLTALPVTRERFAFTWQYYALGELIRERTGEFIQPGKGDRWRANTNVGFGKLFSTGAVLLVAFANQTVIELTNPALPHTRSISTINLDFVQPLLQGGGRAVTLEPLTQAERNLLYDLRDYARFRKLFYQYVSAGTPSINAVGVNFTAPYSGFPRAGGLFALPAGANFVPPGGAGIPQESFRLASPIPGYLNTILAEAQLAIDRQNVEYLEYILTLFENYERGGRISPLQVGLVKQQLLTGQSRVLQSQLDYRNFLDGFKVQLGIPQNVPLELDNCPLRPIVTQLRRYDKAIKDYELVSDRLEKFLETRNPDKLRPFLQELLTESRLAKETKRFKEVAFPTWQKWRAAYPNDKALVARVEELEERIRVLSDERDLLLLDNRPVPAGLRQRLQVLESEYAFLRLEQTVREYEAAPWRKNPDPRERDRLFNRLSRELRNAFLFILIDATNERLNEIRPSWPNVPPIVVDGVNILEGDLDCAYAAVTKAALANRLDLMNARAQVYDSWRKIAVFANSLLGTFNVGYHLDSTTPPNEAKPLAFQPERTRHQLVMNWELPLIRISERNAYRQALIAYQRARRYLQEAEDLVANQVRVEVRQLRVLSENYKIQQEAVDLAYRQVENALETFRAPPPPGDSGASDASAAALTQQLLGAYQRLPTSQNQLLSTWINYRTTRQQLLIDMELMPLDPRGVWIDAFTEDRCCGQVGPGPVVPRCVFGSPVVAGPPAGAETGPSR